MVLSRYRLEFDQLPVGLADALRISYLPDLPVRLGQDVELANTVAAEPEIDPGVAGQVVHGHPLALRQRCRSSERRLYLASPAVTRGGQHSTSGS